MCGVRCDARTRGHNLHLALQLHLPLHLALSSSFSFGPCPCARGGRSYTLSRWNSDAVEDQIKKSDLGSPTHCLWSYGT